MNRARAIRTTELRTGFTLVEMLVAVTLVLMMMVMFGEIFQLASGSVTKQRVMADNDQNVRTFITVLRADLDKRTFRTLVPFFPGELSSNPGTPFEKRRGYFYISNNNIYDGTDDVLQFTVDSTVSLRNPDESRYYGRAEPLTGTSPAAFLSNPNQPDRDDGQITINEAGASNAAEISYWMRAGKIYRRVMILRDPIKGAGVPPDSVKAAQPTNASGNQFFQPNAAYPSSQYSNNFWTDFDFSAHRLPTGFVALPATAPYAIFNGVTSLNNDLPLITGSPFAESIAQSWNRFGHNHEIFPNTPANGLPREFSSAGAPNFFIGRFTQEETSMSEDTNGNGVIDPGEDTPPNGNGNGVLDAFYYPQFPTTYGNGNAMDATGTVLTDADGNGVVDQYANGSRIGTDLLLANVHEFRIEVWDQRIGDFAPIGHSIGIGDYNLGRQLNSTYGPLGGFARVFDTWHPNFDRNFNVPSGTPLGDVPDRAPFRPVTYDPTGVLGTNPALSNPSGNGPYWAPNTSYQYGDVVFPQPGEDLNLNGFLDPGEDGANGFPVDGVLQDRAPGYATEDLNGNGMLDPGEDGFFGFPSGNGPTPDRRTLQLPYFPTALTYAYGCTRAGTSGASRLQEPNWSVGHPIQEPGAGPQWTPIYNVRPLRAIRITLRFEHPQSKQMRQITIVHSLRDTTSVP